MLANDFFQASYFYRNSQNLTWKLKQLPAIKQLLNFAYYREVDSHKATLPKLSSHYCDLLNSLSVKGVAKTNLEELSVPDQGTGTKLEYCKQKANPDRDLTN
jgi:hypothetical protein